MVDAITFRYLISLAIHEKLEIRLMDVVTIYLYGSFDNYIYMKIYKGFKLLEAYNMNSQKFYLIKLNKFLYELKKFGPCGIIDLVNSSSKKDIKIILYVHVFS